MRTPIVVVVTMFLTVFVFTALDRNGSGSPQLASPASCPSTGAGSSDKPLVSSKGEEPTPPPKAQETPTPENGKAPVSPPVVETVCPMDPLGPPSQEVIAGCPNEGEIIRLYAQRKRQRREQGAAKKETWTLVDIGVNKGYSVASALQSIGISGIDEAVVAKSVFNENTRVGAPMDSHRLCGACCDCGSRVDVETEKVSSVKVPSLDNDGKAQKVPALEANYFAFDGQRANAEHLRRMYSTWKPTRDDHIVNMNVTHAAMSAKSGGTVEFGETPFGDEVGGIGEASHPYYGKLKQVAVPKYNLDSFLDPAIDRIDVLLTDTEGHDYFVLDGMSKFISPPKDGEPARNKVGIYVFETWGKDRPIKDVVSYLEKSGYQCYFPLTHPNPVKRKKGRPPGKGWLTLKPPLKRWMVRIDGPCWLDRYNQDGFGWKNIACLDKADADLMWVAEQLTKAEKPMQTCALDRAAEQRLASTSWEWLDSYKYNYVL